MKRRLRFAVTIVCGMCLVGLLAACEKRGNQSNTTVSPTAGTVTHSAELTEIPTGIPTASPTKAPTIVTRVDILPTAIPTPIPEGERPAVVIDTKDVKSKILGIPVSDDVETAVVEVFFGNPQSECEGLFAERYPKEFEIVQKVNSEERNPSGEAELEAFEIYRQFPRIWFEEQAELLFAKHPELRSKRAEGAITQLLLSLTYREILELARDVQVVSIFQPENDPDSYIYAQAIGEYNGHRVYDVTRRQYSNAYSSEWFESDTIGYKLGRKTLGYLEADDYVRVAFSLGMTNDDYAEHLSELRSMYCKGKSDEEWFAWLRSDDGRREVEKRKILETGLGYEAIRSFGWTILEEGDLGDAIANLCPEAFAADGRYIVVLATKAQLMDFLPALRSAVCAGSVPRQSGVTANWGSYTCIRVFWAGTVNGALAGIREGKLLTETISNPIPSVTPIGNVEILPAENPVTLPGGARVVGEYNGHLVYDVANPKQVSALEYEMPENRGLAFCLGEAYNEINADEYLRISLTFGPGLSAYEQLVKQYRAESGMSGSAWQTWFASRSGQEELRRRKQAYVDSCYETIRSIGWPILKEGNSSASLMKNCWSEESTDERYAIVLVTKKQLEEAFPSIAFRASVGCLISLGTTYEWSSRVFLHIFWAGM